MHKSYLTVLAVLLACTTTCGIHQGKFKEFIRKKIADFAKKQALLNEIASWKSAPDIDYFIDVTESVEQNATVNEIRYKAKNGDICKATLTKTKFPGNKSQKSHEFECYKEDVKRRSVRNVMDNDQSLFGDDEDSGESSHGHQGPDTRRQKKKRKKWRKYIKFLDDYEIGNVKDAKKRHLKHDHEEEGTDASDPEDL